MTTYDESDPVDMALQRLRRARHELFAASQRYNDAFARHAALVTDMARLEQELNSARAAVDAARLEVETALGLDPLDDLPDPPPRPAPPPPAPVPPPPAPREPEVAPAPAPAPR